MLWKLAEIFKRIQGTGDSEEKAQHQRLVQDIRKLSDRGSHAFVDSRVRAVAATAFKATLLLRHPIVSALIKERNAPFTTVSHRRSRVDFSNCSTFIVGLAASSVSW
ncbi:MAG: hypothetical protein R3C03_17895 [Pirellulaceae bacterium]